MFSVCSSQSASILLSCDIVAKTYSRTFKNIKTYIHIFVIYWASSWWSTAKKSRGKINHYIIKTGFTPANTQSQLLTTPRKKGSEKIVAKGE